MKIILLFIISLPVLLFSHGNEKHEDKQQNKEVTPTKITSKELQVNKAYLKDIKPIFVVKCFDCHSNQPKYPAYYKIPGVQQLIDKDIKEAKKHIDFSKDFPFISHDTPLNDLKSLKQISLNGGMPPLRYILGHWDSKLSSDDKKKLLQWTNKAIELLETK